MEHLQLDKLKILVAIKEEGSMNAAAEKLYVTKSYLSRTIKELEIDFGFQLLDRSKYRATLTSKAEMYLSRASKLFSYEQELESLRIQLSEDIESEIRFSTTVLYPMDKLIALTQSMHETFSKTVIHLKREVLSGEKLLLENLVDIAIIENFSDKTNLEIQQISSVCMPLVREATEKEETRGYRIEMLVSPWPFASSFERSA